jgi:uncharacterized OsmC-like protein
MEDEKFTANLDWDGETGAKIRAGKFEGLRLDMPKRYGGKGRYPCPDELFLSGVAGCLLTTFLYFRKKLRIKIKRLDISISGTIRREVEGYRISGIRATISVETRKGNEVDVKRCIDLTKEYCHITRSLEKALTVEIVDKIEIVASSKKK